MDVEVVPADLRSRLGSDATDGLVECLEAAGREWKDEAVTQAVERFEHRLASELAELRSEIRSEMREGQAALRVELYQGLAALRVEMREGQAALRIEMRDLASDLRQEISTTRTDLLRWSFVFWVGQMLTTAGLVVGLLRLLQN